MRLHEIARLVDGVVEGNGDVEILRLSKIEEAEEGEIAFLDNPKYAKHLASTRATAVLIMRDVNFKELTSRTEVLHVVRVENPRRSFSKLIDIFHPPVLAIPKGIHSSAQISKNAVIGPHVAIGANVVVGDHCVIGDRVTLHPNVVIYDDVTIGADTFLYANVTVREQCAIGSRVIIHPGAVIGSDGFGFAPKPDGSFEKIPQRGNVVIEDDVEIGANTTIDRATIGETRIKRGVKLDNLIQIAHNVIVGEHTVIAAQSAIAGSSKIGKNCVISGQVGFVGHIRVADRSTIGAQAGVTKSFTEPGKTYSSYPAKEHNKAMRMEGALRQLPDLLIEIRRLQERVKQLEKHIESTIQKAK